VLLDQPGALASDSNPSASFDGARSYVRVPASPSLNMTSAVMVEFWAKRRTISNTYQHSSPAWSQEHSRFGHLVRLRGRQPRHNRLDNAIAPSGHSSIVVGALERSSSEGGVDLQTAAGLTSAVVVASLAAACMKRSLEKLGVYVDGPFRIVETPTGCRIACHPSDYPFLLFLSEVGRNAESLAIFGRVKHSTAIDDFVVIPPNIELVELPYFDELSQLGRVAAATPGTVAGFWRGLEHIDRVWVLGPHPLGLILIALAALRRRRVVLGIRQDTVAYFRPRLPSRRWKILLPALEALDASFRLLARRFKTVVVGPAIAAQYGRAGPRLLIMADSLVSEHDLAAGPKEQEWGDTIDLLAVSRVDPEKNPLLLIDSLGRLERKETGRYRLVLAGGGPLVDAVRERAAVLGVADRLELRGWIPFGPELLDLYRQAHIFIHVSLNEGVPRVLYEAMACGTPIVATDVGGVRSALDDGRAGLLVPPNDLSALVDAVRQLADDPKLRKELVIRGLELVQELTLETQAARVARFVADAS
jgi:glycosyltransferase involved in cell wall biosynthesis